MVYAIKFILLCIAFLMWPFGTIWVILYVLDGGMERPDKDNTEKPKKRSTAGTSGRVIDFKQWKKNKRGTYL